MAALTNKQKYEMRVEKLKELGVTAERAELKKLVDDCKECGKHSIDPEVKSGLTITPRS